MSLSPKVAASLDAAFRAEDRPAAQDLLFSATESERVMLAILGLSEGDLSSLAHFSEQARQDWRDVLYWHEYPRDDDEPRCYSELRERTGLPPDPDHPG